MSVDFKGANVEASPHISVRVGAEKECDNMGLRFSCGYRESCIKLSSPNPCLTKTPLLPPKFAAGDIDVFIELIIFVSEVMLISKHKTKKKTGQTTFFFL